MDNTNNKSIKLYRKRERERERGAMRENKRLRTGEKERVSK